MSKRRDDLFIEFRRAWRKNYAAHTAGRCLTLSGRKFNKYRRENKSGESIEIFMDPSQSEMQQIYQSISRCSHSS